MRIAFVQNVPINDHRMIHTDGVARELLKRGHNVDVIIQESDEKLQFSNLPYKVIYIPGGTYSILGQLKFAYGLYKFLKKRKYDVIHTKNPFSSILPVLMRKSGAKVVYDVRGLWIDFGVHSGDIPGIIVPFLRHVDMLCMRKANRVIAISNELKNMLVERGLDECKVNVIVGDGVNLNKINSLQTKDIRDALGINGKVIGYVGSISEARNSHKIIESFEFLKNKYKAKINLVMIGPIYDKPFFMDLIAKKNLMGDVHFIGFIKSHDEVLSFIKSFDVVVAFHDINNPCFNVMVPTKILEYMATGSSIIATNHKCHRSLLKHRYNGYLTGQTPEAFSRGLLHVLKNKELRNKMSLNSKITAKSFSFQKIVDQLETLY